MKKTYILKKDVKIPDELKASDALKRSKVEAIMGRKLTNYEWDSYKRLIMQRPKNQ